MSRKKSKIQIHEFSMFRPKSKRGLLIDYPELKKVPAIAGLQPAEILFAYYMGSRLSPLFNSDESVEERAREAVKLAELDVSKPDISKWVRNEIPDKVRAGIAAFEKYIPGVRIRCKLMVEEHMLIYEEVTKEAKTHNPETEDGEVDWTKKKASIDTINSIQKNLPSLIAMVESGFGIESNEKETEVEMGSLVDMHADQTE